MLYTIRESLLAEARLSPQLLADLAGLEHYIAESYSARSLIELLQNADDAGARRFTVATSKGFAIVANDGRPFHVQDFESLCRSASSGKTRGTSIGFRGIGFKSVVGVSSAAYVLSGELEAKFSRSDTAKAVGVSSAVPLIRIPHPIPESERRQFASAIDALQSEGYVTFFVLESTGRQSIADEFQSFADSSLLFLRCIEQVQLHGIERAVINVIRKNEGASSLITIHRANREQQWRLTRGDGENAIAVKMLSGVPIACEETEAAFHAFLPTLDSVGLLVKINGDFSTDPSRTRLVIDDRTSAVFRDAARTLCRILRDSITSGNSALLEAVVGANDPRMIEYQRVTASTAFLRVLREEAEWFRGLSLAPPWLQIANFEHLASRVGMRHLPTSSAMVPGVMGLMRFLGAQEASFADLCGGIDESISVATASELSAYCVNRIASKQMEEKAFDAHWPLWWDGERLRSTKQLSSACRIDGSFLDLLSERGVSRAMLTTFLRGHTTEDVLSPAPLLSSTLVPLAGSPPSTLPAFNGSSLGAVQTAIALSRNDGPSVPPSNIALRKWRTAEQYMLDVLKADGFEVTDVSRQNIGYDIEARDMHGNLFAIEVKSLDYVGMPFTLTSNEEAVARQRGERYILALVQQDADKINVMMVSDPLASLPFVRQCRQWVWECSEYAYRPISYMVP